MTEVLSENVDLVRSRLIDIGNSR